MPCGEQQLELDIPIRFVWKFVSDMNNWAPLVPGYKKHEIINDKQSIWEFKGDIGIIQKTITLKIDIIEWKEPTTVSFNLTGLNENFVGSGSFKAVEVNKKLTTMTGSLNIIARGLTGPMINQVLKSFVPKTTKEFTIAVADKIIELETVTI